MIQARPTEWPRLVTTWIGIRLWIRYRRKSVTSKNDVDRVTETMRTVVSFEYVRMSDAEEDADGHADM